MHLPRLRTRLRPLIGAVIASSLLAPSVRAADTPAEVAITRGVALRRERKDEEALAEFRRAYALEPSARALAQIALAEASLQRWIPAESDLLRALAGDDPWIARQRAGLQLAINEIAAHIGILEVDGPDGAEVWIDGNFAGRLPVPRLRVPAGRLVVELRAAGFEPSRGEAEVHPDGVAHLALSLVPTPPGPGAPAAAPVEEPQKPRDAARVQRTVAWATGVSAAVLLAGGVAATIYGADRSARYNDNANCGDLPGLPRSARCPSYASQVHAAEALEAIGYVAGGLSAVTTAALVLTLPASSRTTLRAACSPTLGGASCTFLF
jgi:hypothetical protein